MLDTLTTEGVEPPRTATMVRMQIQPGYRPQPSQHDGQLKLCVPPMPTTVARCSSRASRAAATVASPKAVAQSAIPTLVLRMVEDLRYRWLMTWNRAEAPSPGSGRYPSSSITSSRGPAKNRMQVAQRPSMAALWHLAASSAAVVK